MATLRDKKSENNKRTSPNIALIITVQFILSYD